MSLPPNLPSLQLGLNMAATPVMRKAIVLNALSQHQGQAQGIHAEELAAKCGMTKRQVRKAVEAMREEGMAICAKPETGYFVAVTEDELDLSCKFLRSRALKSLRQEARMRNISMPDLIGQLHLTT